MVSGVSIKFLHTELAICRDIGTWNIVYIIHSPPSLPTVRIYCSVYSGTLCTSVLRSSDVELERFYMEFFKYDLVNSV